ncbi:hypothetical protein JXA84_00550, partial [candidate division WOR-3 bacterium]|nr:hypothetical protein [candidate division WOR-3 bacterium]
MRKSKLVSLLVVLTLMSCAKQKEKEIYKFEKILEIDGNENPFFTPTGFEIDNKGRYLVLDHMASRIFLFNDSGGLISEFGGKGEAPGEFSFLRPRLDRDTAGFFYFIDQMNKIVIFNSEMEYFRTFIIPGGVIFDVAALDTSHIYVNQALSIAKESENVILLLNSRGEVLGEFGVIDKDIKEMDLWKANAYRSCAMELDEESNLYYTSIADYRIYKYDPSGNLMFSVKGNTPYEVIFSEDHNFNSIVWDMRIRRGKIFVLWAQGGEERGHRVDVFDKDEGLFLGYFYTGIPS